MVPQLALLTCRCTRGSSKRQLARHHKLHTSAHLLAAVKSRWYSMVSMGSVDAAGLRIAACSAWRAPTHLLTQGGRRAPKLFARLLALTQVLQLQRVRLKVGLQLKTSIMQMLLHIIKDVIIRVVLVRQWKSRVTCISSSIYVNAHACSILIRSLQNESC